MKILKKILIALLLTTLLALSLFSAYYFAVTKDSKLDRKKLLLPDVQISAYNNAGEKIAGAYAFENRETIALGNLHEYTKNAFVCTEDKRFYSHNGFDVRRIAKAALNNLRSGSFKEGASTISQQLIKNTHLSLEKTVKRKLQEWKLTRTLEHNYSKDEILEMYLNTIYFGHSSYGIQSAAEFYFGKTADKLSLAESALLAGLVKAPNNYSPFKNAEKCLARRKTVLTLMREQNAIEKAEYEAALNTPLPTSPSYPKNGFSYLHFALDELEELSERHGFPISGKTEIFTYLDSDLQSLLESRRAETQCDKTFAVLDNTTHGFKAFVSTIGNVKRLPASAIKPLAVYAPALELGLISPATPLLDEKTTFGDYAPENYGGVYHGYVSAREALSLSLNVPAVKLLNTLGVKNALPYLNKMGLQTDETDGTLALALGGMKEGFTLKNLVSAYSTFACDGKYTEGSFLKEIKIDGKTVYRREYEERAVFSPETAYVTTDILKTTVKEGTAKKLRSLPFDVAAKTGTGGTKNGNTDIYALSYTPLDTVGVWLGKADNTPIEQTGGGIPCNISLDIHEFLYEQYDKSIDSFEQPLGVKRVFLDKPIYEKDGRLIVADDLAPAQYKFNELFISKYAPNEKSEAFSNPTVPSATVSLTDGRVNITFAASPYAFYNYKIERECEGRTQTLYEGAAIPLFSDDNLESEKTYVYKISASFNGVSGKTAILPAVSTKNGGEILTTPPKITDKNWWDY